MKLNWLERIVVNSPLRAWVQQNIEIPFFNKLHPLPHHASVLEVGCGSGAGLVALHRACTPTLLVGTDIDTAMLNITRRRMKEKAITAHIYQEDATTLATLPDNTFDAVFSFGVLHHLPEWQRGVATIHRVLKPNGVFYGLEFYAPLICNPVIRRLLVHPQHNRFTHTQLMNQLEQTKFTLPKAQNYGGLFGLFAAIKQ